MGAERERKWMNVCVLIKLEDGTLIWAIAFVSEKRLTRIDRESMVKFNTFYILWAYEFGEEHTTMKGDKCYEGEVTLKSLALRNFSLHEMRKK